MRVREAKCHCGELKITCEGEPTEIYICHCELCQRRTGSTFNVNALFDSAHVSVEGESETYQRKGDLGIMVVYKFCRKCGSNLFWNSDFAPGQTGIAVGCFADPDFPQPTASLFGEKRHAWVNVPDGIPSFYKMPTQ